MENPFKERVAVTSTKVPKFIRTHTDCSLLVRELHGLQPPYIVEIKPMKEYAGNTQKALYFIWVGKICAENKGMIPAETDRTLRKYFLPWKTHVLFGKTETVATRISDLTKSEMSDFMSHVQAWAATEGGLELKSNKDE